MKIDDGEVVNDKDILEIVNDLSRNPNNQKTIQKVLNYITHQIQEKEVLRSQLKIEEKLKEKEIKNLIKITKHLHINSSEEEVNAKNENNDETSIKNYDITSILLEIKKLRKLSHDSYDYLFIIHEIVNILTKSVKRSCQSDENVAYCINRLKRWLEFPKTRINLCQEINYLISALIQSRLSDDQILINFNYDELANSNNGAGDFLDDDDLSSVSVDSVIRKMEMEKRSQQQSLDASQQINELKETVEELRKEITINNSERKDFIRKNLKGSVSQSASWKKICLHLLNKLKNQIESKQNDT